MPSWWDSIEMLSRLGVWLRFAMVGFGVVVALAAGFTVVVQQRIATLRHAPAGAVREAEAVAVAKAEPPAHVSPRLAAPPRGFTPQRRAQFLETLHWGRPLPVQVMFSQDDAEARDFAAQLATLLGAAGWTVRSSAPMPHAAAPEGLFVTIRAPAATPPDPTVPGTLLSAMTVVSALRAAGFQPTPDLDATLAANELRIFVGRQPSDQANRGPVLPAPAG